jgi:SAM-dependent methyltransferase
LVFGAKSGDIIHDMADIELYEESAGAYEELQLKRPDYAYARKAFLDLASILLKGKSLITLADFCCGTGNNTRLIADHFSVKKATLIDINKEFLEIAKKSGIRASDVDTIESDILFTQLRPEHDLVISMFAYHHVPDDAKEKYLEIAKDALKVGGILLLGEIYSPDKDTTLKYYEHLLDSIDVSVKTPELEKFLMQTANSDHFEYKISRRFAHDQLMKAGFVLRDAFKIWPKDKSFPDDVGTFVEAWELTDGS